MNIVWTVLVPLADKTPDPEDVKPGWVAFGIFLLLAVAVVLLAMSLVKHLKRARTNFEEMDSRDEREHNGSSAG